MFNFMSKIDSNGVFFGKPSVSPAKSLDKSTSSEQGASLSQLRWHG